MRSMGELLHPAQCMVCGNGTCEQGYLDLGVFFDFEGTMYLCFTCITQAGETAGMYTPEEMQLAESIGEKALGEVSALTSEVESLRESNNSLSFLLTQQLRAEPRIADAITEAEFGSNEQPALIVEGTDAGKPTLTEPTPIKRRSEPRGS